MAAAQIPQSGINLHGAPNTKSHDKEPGTIARSAVLLRLNQQIIDDLKQCSQNGKVIQLLSGKAPKLRIGTKMVDLLVTPETFRHELYRSDKSSNDMVFSALVTQQASLKTVVKKPNDTAGADAALANLKQSLASFAQDKEAKKATIASNVIPAGKAKSLNPHRNLLEPRSHSHVSSPSYESSLTPHHGSTPTSAPISDTQEAAKVKAMRKVLIHYLARGAADDKELTAATKIDTQHRTLLLCKIAISFPGSTKWNLADKIYKELDVWEFPYKTNKDRQTAIDSAVRAFDRLRLSKDDKLWQMLLPKEERGKGKILSRLHSGTAAQAKKPLTNLAPSSPFPALDSATDGQDADGKFTPRPGATPRSGATGTGKGGMSIEKRLKESKKQREAEEAKLAKAQKKNEKDAAAIDRENKPKVRADSKLGGQAQAGKYKSEEVVHSSDDEEDDAARRAPGVMKIAKTARAGGAPLPPKDRKVVGASPALKASMASKGRPASETSDSSDVPLKAASQLKVRPVAAQKAASSAKALEKHSQAAKVGTPMARDTPTPSGRKEKHGSGAEAASIKHQLSPSKLDTKPRVPSPLGATRNRHDSDVSIKKSSLSSVTGKAVNGNSKGDASSISGKMAQSSTSRKRPLDSSDETDLSRKTTKVTANGTPGGSAKPAAKAIKPATNGMTPRDTDSGPKRKANDISTGTHDHDIGYDQKHQRAESSSSQSVANGSSLATSTARTSVASPSGPHSPGWQRSPSGGSSSSEGVKLSWERALEEGEKFRNLYYPAYIELYNRLDALPIEDVKSDDRRKLYEMHERLKQMKKEIASASPPGSSMGVST